ncbi:hypothetical protein G9A89_010835 [Geosiphon pyriformis]|nr:hypothetical protein G9A89_010835 [Geosiphon pyriformis]
MLHIFERELVGSSAGGFNTGLTGLGFQSETKKKAQVESVYTHNFSYKKSKKSGVTGVVVESEDASISEVLDVENMDNIVAEETSYIDSNTSETDNMVDNTTSRKMQTKTYVLGLLPKTPSFKNLSDDNTELVLPESKFVGSNQLLSAKSCVPDRHSFEPVKSFVLDMELAAVPGKTNGIIKALFTSEFNMNKAKKLAICEKIIVNNDLRKVNSCSDWEVIIKKIPVNFPKLAIESVFSKFGKIVSIKVQLIGLWQKALVKFESSEIANLVTARWPVFMKKDFVHVVKAVNNKQTWVSRDQHQTLLYTLSVGTTAYDLSSLVDSYGRKTCFIGHNPGSYAHNRCVVVCFNNEVSKLAVIDSVSVYKGVNLCWVGLSLAHCTKYKHFGHIFDVCLVHLANIYKRKQAPVVCLVFFGGKTWAQIASSLSFHVASSVPSGAGSTLSVKLLVVAFNSLDNSGLTDHMVSLECSIELLSDQVSEILRKLSFVKLVLMLSSSCILSHIVASPMDLALNIDMAVDSMVVPSLPSSPAVGNTTPELSLSSSKIFTIKVGGLESKMMALEVLVGLVLTRLDSLCFGLNSGYLGSDIAIIMNTFLAHYVYKVSEMPGRILCVKLLFKNKLSVSILGLYVGASLVVWFSQAGDINSLIAKAVNESFFVILDSDFNEDESHKCASFKKCFDLGLVNSLAGSIFAKISTWCNSHAIAKTIDYVFIFSNLVNVIIGYKVASIMDYFDTDYMAVSVSVGLGGSIFDAIHSELAKARKFYYSFKLLKSKYAEESCIKQTIISRMESFELDKSCIIRSVLECPFHKIVLDHLVVGDELVLEPDLSLDYVFDGVFFSVIYLIDSDELFVVVSNLPNGKAAGLSGISNELWKHCNNSVLAMLFVLLNLCLIHKSVPGSWREAWISMIPKPYEWKDVFTNTCPIALIEMACKILFKILLKQHSKNNFKVAITPDATTLEYYQLIYTHCKQKFNIPDGIEIVKKSVYQYIENHINNYLFGNYNISEVRSNLYNNLVHYSQLGTEDLNSETLATYFQELNFNIIKYCEETYSTETSNKGKQKLKQYSKTTPNTPILPKTTAKHLQTPEQETSSKLLLTITLFPALLAQAQTPNSLLNQFARLEDFTSLKTENQSEHSETAANKENDSEISEEESIDSENEEDKMTAYIAKIPEFNGEDIKTSPQEWLNQVTKAEDANGWNAARMKFNKLLRRIRQLETNNYYSNAQILDQFIAGLKDKLIKKVHSHAPEDLNSAIQHAKRYEMAMKKANHTKLMNLTIGETSSAAEEKIDQLTKKVKNYFINQQQQQPQRYQPPQRQNQNNFTLSSNNQP